MLELDTVIRFTVSITQTKEDKQKKHIFLQVPKNSKEGSKTRRGRWDFPSPYPMCLRIVRFQLDSGVFETIATSLPNMFTLEDIRELYHLRWGIDGVYPLDKSFRKAYRAGVTCACVRPGSVDCISGTHLAMKTYGRRIDSMAMKNPASMKAVFGENSKIHLKDRLTTRISIAAAIRDTLLFAKEYWEEKEYAEQTHTRKPCFDPKLEALRPIIKKEIPLKAYVLCTDDIFTTIRIAGECDVRLTLEHVTEGGLIADLLAKEG